ncbi:TetR/AcrR family transcriptional regulator [Gordonia sp. VNQ95]|jgi:AcrR family transcriptional regulator|uniref:TetR/AcrR family transcriptional regulator n=1 Tax=Gordonia TaxID=2053 RepID=UPI0032B37AC7
MNVNGRRTQAERTAATRAALVGAGRELFGRDGYAGVGTQAIVERAGVTRGALYHQFDDKRGLFTAVFDELEQDVARFCADAAAELVDADPVAALKAGIRAFLEYFHDPAAQTIGLVDAPAVLGWAAWRARGEEFGFALVESLLAAAMEAGQIIPGPTRPMAHVALGALDESALFVAAAEDSATATAQVTAILDRIVDSFTTEKG